MEQLKENLNGLLRGKKKTTLLLTVGIIGMLLIAFSGMGEEKDDTPTDTVAMTDAEYSAELEKKIKELVAAITGDADCIVGITLENGSEYIYANQNTLDSDQTEDKAADGTTTKESHKSEEEYIIVEGKDGEQTALIVTEKKPSVRGVAIVAQGINDMTSEKISNSVSSMLGIPSRKISITEKS